MTMPFNASEVFDIAVDIERDGAAFYRKAMGLVADEEMREELRQLAEMEDAHEMTFTSLKKQFVGEQSQVDWFDPNGEAAGYLKNFASGQVFDMTVPPLDTLPANPSVHDILSMALRREGDTVLFFTGVANALPDGEASQAIDTIIKQEMGHVTLLSNKLRNL